MRILLALVMTGAAAVGGLLLGGVAAGSGNGLHASHRAENAALPGGRLIAGPRAPGLAKPTPTVDTTQQDTPTTKSSGGGGGGSSGSGSGGGSSSSSSSSGGGSADGNSPDGPVRTQKQKEPKGPIQGGGSG